MKLVTRCHLCVFSVTKQNCEKITCSGMLFQTGGLLSLRSLSLVKFTPLVEPEVEEAAQTHRNV